MITCEWIDLLPICVQVLVTHRPESTTALLMQLCTAGDSSKPDGEWVAKVASFTHLYDER